MAARRSSHSRGSGARPPSSVMESCTKVVADVTQDSACLRSDILCVLNRWHLFATVTPDGPRAPPHQHVERSWRRRQVQEARTPFRLRFGDSLFQGQSASQLHRACLSKLHQQRRRETHPNTLREGGEDRNSSSGISLSIRVLKNQRTDVAGVVAGSPMPRRPASRSGARYRAARDRRRSCPPLSRGRSSIR